MEYPVSGCFFCRRRHVAVSVDVPDVELFTTRYCDWAGVGDRQERLPPGRNPMPCVPALLRGGAVACRRGASGLRINRDSLRSISSHLDGDEVLTRAAVACRSVPSSAVPLPLLEKRERRLLRGVLEEVRARETCRLQALEREARKLEGADTTLTVKAASRASTVPRLLAEVAGAERQLTALIARVETAHGGQLHDLRSELESLGLGKRLETFDVDAQPQFGRPAGFTGLVLETPRGVPILVGQRRWSDTLLRRVGGGSDLWFQSCGRARDGSRVLLRTSLRRELTQSHRECMQCAADVAAYFSDERHSTDPVEVMFTDTRGTGTGSRAWQLKRSKRLGVLLASPAAVARLVTEAQQEQVVARL